MTPFSFLFSRLSIQVPSACLDKLSVNHLSSDLLITFWKCGGSNREIMFSNREIMFSNGFDRSLFQMQPRIVLALLATLSPCQFKFSLLLLITPRPFPMSYFPAMIPSSWMHVLQFFSLNVIPSISQRTSCSSQLVQIFYHPRCVIFKCANQPINPNIQDIEEYVE